MDLLSRDMSSQTCLPLSSAPSRMAGEDGELYHEDSTTRVHLAMLYHVVGD